MSDQTNQTHSAGGDNVGRDKITYNYGDRKVPKFLTSLPGLEEAIIGRDKDIQRLGEHLRNSPQVVLMNGMGGIGKTTTAIAYANRHLEEYKHIAWIEQLDNFANDLLSNKVLLHNLGFTPSDDPMLDAQLILNQIGNLEGPSLLIIDNGEEELEKFKDYFPKSPNWQVLITSRERLSMAFIMDLDFLTEEDALRLFYNHYQLDQDDECLRRILADIDFHTLTIELLSKFAQRRRIASIAELERLLQERGLKIGRPLNIKVKHKKDQKVEKLFPYLETIFSLDDEISNIEIWLLQQFIALPPIFVDEELIHNVIQGYTEEEQERDLLQDALLKLAQKGWLIHDTEENSFKMHRIIQEVLQKSFRPSDQELQVLINVFSDALYIDETQDNPVDKFFLVPYAEYLLNFISENNKELGLYRYNLASLYRHLGRLEDAADLLKKILQTDPSHLSDRHPPEARTQSNLALVYEDLGRLKEATVLLEKSLQSYIQKYGEDHPFVATTQSNLANVYRRLGRFKEAAVLLEKALQSDLQQFGENHPAVATKQSNLALVYRQLGRFKEATDLLEKALQTGLQQFGENHPLVAIRQNNLALVYQDLGRLKEAAVLLEKALQTGLQQFGKNHPVVTIRQNNLALVYQDLGRLKEAAVLLEKALQTGLQQFGKNHPTVAIRQNNLASVYQDLGRLKEAAVLLEKALQANLQQFGENHPEVAIRQNNLASVYQDLGRIQEARNLWEQSYNTRIKLYGTNHPKTLTVKEFLDDLNQTPKSHSFTQKIKNLWKNMRKK